MALVFLQTHHTAMAQLYDRLLMLSIAIQNAPFSLIVSFSHSKPSTTELKRLIQTNLTLQIAQLAPGDLDLITILWPKHAPIQD